MSKHTEGKLQIVAEKDDGQLWIEFENPRIVHTLCKINHAENHEGIEVTEEDKANAARLVKCWNMHNDLISSLKELIAPMQGDFLDNIQSLKEMKIRAEKKIRAENLIKQSEQ